MELRLDLTFETWLIVPRMFLDQNENLSLSVITQLLQILIRSTEDFKLHGQAQFSIEENLIVVL